LLLVVILLAGALVFVLVTVAPLSSRNCALNTVSGVLVSVQWSFMVS
jgi:hypothetical protein